MLEEHRGLGNSCLELCALSILLLLMLNLFYGFGFTTGMTNVIIGLTGVNAMAYGWHLFGRLPTTPLVPHFIWATMTLVRHKPVKLISCITWVVLFTVVVKCLHSSSFRELVITAHASISPSKSARGKAVLYVWLMLFMKAPVRCQTVVF